MKSLVERQKECLQAINAQRDSLLGSEMDMESTLREVKKVVIINSAPRSGSSLLFDILRKTKEIYSLNGESVPFYKLSGFSGDLSGSDTIQPEVLDENTSMARLERDLLSDMTYVGKEEISPEEAGGLGEYINRLLLRFCMQWPFIEFDHDVFKRTAFKAYDVYSSANNVFVKQYFYIDLLKELRKEYGNINPYYYDIPTEVVKENFPECVIPEGPPNDVIMVEEPPFVLVTPGRKVTKDEFREKTLLLKSPVNCYRMGSIEKLLPHAEIKIIYLTRNPAASINGLYGGWLYRGFFSHNLGHILRDDSRGGGLKIAGYSDKFKWGNKWWKFDLPPGWRKVMNKSLEEVCAFQWVSANRAILDHLHNENVSVCRLKYEDIASDLTRRKEEIRKVLDFIGIHDDITGGLHLDELPVVQATQPPVPYRWQARRDIVMPVVERDDVADISREMGYSASDIEGWT